MALPRIFHFLECLLPFAIFRGVFFAEAARRRPFRPVPACLVVIGLGLLHAFLLHMLRGNSSYIAIGTICLLYIFLEVLLVALAAQGIGSNTLVVRGRHFRIEKIHHLPTATCLIVSVYALAAAQLTPFVMLEPNDDGCSVGQFAPYDYVLLLVNMVPGYEACIENAGLFYRTVRHAINLVVVGILLAELQGILSVGRNESPKG